MSNCGWVGDEIMVMQQLKETIDGIGGSHITKAHDVGTWFEAG